MEYEIINSKTNIIFNSFTKNGKDVGVQLRKGGEELGEIWEAEYNYNKNKTKENQEKLKKELADGWILKTQLKNFKKPNHNELITIQCIAYNYLNETVSSCMNQYNISEKELMPYIEEKLDRTIEIIMTMQALEIGYEEAKEIVLDYNKLVEKVTVSSKKYEQ